MKMLPKKEIKRLKEIYPEGTIVELLSMDDRQAPPPHTYGKVVGVDDIGQIMMEWDTGSSLSLIPEIDNFRKVK